MVGICGLSQSGRIDAKTAHTVQMHVFNIYFQTSNTHKNIMLPCSWKWRQRVMLTTPLTYSLSWRIIHHCWWSKIAPLLRQDWVSSVRMFSGKQDYMAISPKQGEYNGEMFIEWREWLFIGWIPVLWWWIYSLMNWLCSLHEGGRILMSCCFNWRD